MQEIVDKLESVFITPENRNQIYEKLSILLYLSNKSKWTYYFDQLDEYHYRESYILLAAFKYKLTLYVDALDELNKYSNSTNPLLLESEINLNLLYGKIYYQLGNYENALEYYKKINSRDSLFVQGIMTKDYQSALKNSKNNLEKIKVCYISNNKINLDNYLGEDSYHTTLYKLITKQNPPIDNSDLSSISALIHYNFLNKNFNECYILYKNIKYGKLKLVIDYKFEADLYLFDQKYLLDKRIIKLCLIDFVIKIIVYYKTNHINKAVHELYSVNVIIPKSKQFIILINYFEYLLIESQKPNIDHSKCVKLLDSAIKNNEYPIFLYYNQSNIFEDMHISLIKHAYHSTNVDVLKYYMYSTSLDTESRILIAKTIYNKFGYNRFQDYSKKALPEFGYKIALSLYNSGKYLDSINIIKDFNIDNNELLALNYIKLCKYQEAIPFFEVLSLNNDKMYYNLTKCYIETKNKEKANYYIERCKNLDLGEYIIMKTKIFIMDD